MPNYTTNLNLTKPLISENYSIAVANGNNDIIDSAVALKAPLASPTFTGTVVLPATTSIGLVSNTELGYLDGVTSAIQTQLGSKAPLAGPTFTGTLAAPTINASTALQIGGVAITATAAELNYVDGVTSNIQTQLGDKQYELVSGTNIKSLNGSSILGSGNLALEEVIGVALSDETTAITTGTAKATIRMPYACKLTSRLPRISVNTASSSGLPTVDINKSGATILTNKLTIDANEKTSTTATTACSLVNTPTTFTDDEEVTFDIDVAGTGAKGLKVYLFVERT